MNKIHYNTRQYILYILFMPIYFTILPYFLCKLLCPRLATGYAILYTGFFVILFFLLLIFMQLRGYNELFITCILSYGSILYIISMIFVIWQAICNREKASYKITKD